MPTIKFSYPFRKLYTEGHLVPHAKLLEVQKVKIEDLTQEFLDFDTDDGKYMLPPKGNYLRLLFLKPGIDGNLFTTLRPFRPGKNEYYKSQIGQIFDVVVIDPLF